MTARMRALQEFSGSFWADSTRLLKHAVRGTCVADKSSKAICQTSNFPLCSSSNHPRASFIQNTTYALFIRSSALGVLHSSTSNGILIYIFLFFFFSSLHYIFHCMPARLIDFECKNLRVLV